MTPQQLKWIAALESGEYQQGRAALNRGGAFCCLGVACDLFKDELGLITREKDSLTFYDEFSGYPPGQVAEHLGLYNRYGRAAKDTGLNSLSELNDQGKTFEEIVEAIKTGLYFR
jgi:hypothetical protein